MKSLCDPFIKRPVATTLFAISISLLGIAAYLKLPVSSLPKIDYPVISVAAAYPGMGAEMMANSIANPLEKEFMQIDGLSEVLSENRLGISKLTLNFNLDKSVTTALTEVQAAISRAQSKLPHDMPSAPEYSKKDPNSEPIFFILIASNTMNMGDLYEYAKTKVAQQINTISGISQAMVFGTPRAVRINLDTRKMRLFNLSTNDITNAIKTHTMILSMGKLKGDVKTITLKSNGQLSKAKDYNKIVIKNIDNKQIYLENIATCEDGYEMEDFKVRFYATQYKKNIDSIAAVAVFQASDANTIDVAKKIKSTISYLQKNTPSDIVLAPVFDKSKSISDSIGEVKETIIIAFILVAIVIFLFFGRARETIIPVIAIPLSLFITFITMKVLGYNIDNLSLLALTLAIGFLVDDAIVFLENVVRHIENGLSPIEAAFKGAKEISFTILSMTFSLMATFIPIVFMNGIVGRIFREFAVTIIVSILASGIVSLTVTPMMCSRLLKKRKNNEKNKIETISFNAEQWFLKWYKEKLQWFCKRRRLGWMIWLVCLISMIVLFIKLPKSFLPIGDSSSMFGVFMANTGVSPKQMQVYQDQVLKVLKTHPSVEVVISTTGIDSFLSSNQGMLFIMLKDKKHRKLITRNKDTSIDTICRELQGMLFRVPGILPLIKPMPVLNIQTSTSDNKRGKYVYSLTGVDIINVNKAAKQLLSKFVQINGIDINSLNCNVEDDEPTLDVNYNRLALPKYVIAPYTLENTIKDSLSLNYSYLIKENTEQYKVIVSASKNNRRRSEDLENLSVVNTYGKSIPMKALISAKKIVGMSSVYHKNNFPCADIFFNLNGKESLGKTIEKVNKIAESVCKNEIEGSLGGESKEFVSSVRSLTFLLFVAVFVMYVVLGCLYEHWIHPITVLSTLPMALSCGLLTLLIFGQECSIYAFIGLFMLMGIIKKNGIILVDFAIEKQKQGLSPEDSVVEACCERFRPILMTTVSTVLGILPIALGFGSDGSSRMPLGLAVAGGLTLSQILTLFVTPVIYLSMNKNDKK